MITLEQLSNIKSIRDFKDTELQLNDLNFIKDFFSVLGANFDGQVNFSIVSGKHIFSNKYCKEVGYNGFIIEAPSFIVFTAKETSNNALLFGQLIQPLLIELYSKGIGSCWNSVSDNSPNLNRELNKDENLNILSIISIGYIDEEATSPSKDEIKKSIFSWINPYKSTSSHSHVVSDRNNLESIALNCKMIPISYEELEKRNVEKVLFYAKLAPSYENRQPWKFVIQNSCITLVIKHSKRLPAKTSSYLEAGIVMSYFEIAMHNLGFTGDWNHQHKEGISYNGYAEVASYFY